MPNAAPLHAMMLLPYVLVHVRHVNSLYYRSFNRLPQSAPFSIRGHSSSDHPSNPRGPYCFWCRILLSARWCCSCASCSRNARAPFSSTSKCSAAPLMRVTVGSDDVRFAGFARRVGPAPGCRIRAAVGGGGTCSGASCCAGHPTAPVSAHSSSCDAV